MSHRALDTEIVLTMILRDNPIRPRWIIKTLKEVWEGYNRNGEVTTSQVLRKSPLDSTLVKQ